MSWTRRFIWAFWIFVITMLLWQFYLYNQKVSAPGAEPAQGHYFFYQPSLKNGGPPVVHDSAFVAQTQFTISDNTPSSASFTCHITLKNTGKAKAVDVQVRVRPYRGAVSGDVDMGDMGRKGDDGTDDTTTLARFGQYVEFPDLAPGQSYTQDSVFLKQAEGNYGKNPAPEIIYQTEKKK